LTENAIAVIGEEDGVFNETDFVLFFGSGPDHSFLASDRNSFYYQNNIYSDQNFYFLTVSDTNGKRIGTSENIAGSFPVISTFNDFVYHEKDEYNELHSGREWFGEKFSPGQTISFDVTMNGIVNGSSVTVVSDVMAKSTTGSSFKISFNGVPVGEQSVQAITGAQYMPRGH